MGGLCLRSLGWVFWPVAGLLLVGCIRFHLGDELLKVYSDSAVVSDSGGGIGVGAGVVGWVHGDCCLWPVAGLFTLRGLVLR